MIEALRADPCRFAELLMDPRALYRVWRNWRRRGTAAIFAELSPGEGLELAIAAPERPSALAMTSMGNIFVIDATIPQYDRDAGGRSSFLYLHMLREMGYAVFFMPNDQLRREPYAAMLEGIGVKLLVGKAYRCGRWKNWLEAQAGQITHVILHRPNVAKRHLPVVKRIGGFKVLYFAHDLRCLREERHYEVDGDPFHHREARYWEMIEKTIISQVDVAYFFSEEEARIASTWSGAAAHTVPLFPLSNAPSSGLPFGQRAGLLFVGGFAHQPNLDAVAWFAAEVFPRVRSVLPDIEWHIVGREPPPEIRSLADKKILVEGAVSEARLHHLYQNARLVIAPLRYGAGVKGKVVEAMCQGVPVITTAVGAQGIPDGEQAVCVSTSAEDMARQILEMYQTPDLWEALRARAVQAMDKHFSRRAALMRLSQDLDSAPT
jgi:O-antigen biosynthesis protein